MANTKKDFSTITAGRVYDSIERSTARPGQQGTASTDEAAERAEALKTQGRKGCKAIRINMAFTPSNHAFIRTMARASGHTMTEFTNIVIQAYRDEHPEMLAQAEAFLQYVQKDLFPDKAAEADAEDKGE